MSEFFFIKIKKLQLLAARIVIGVKTTNHLNNNCIVPQDMNLGILGQKGNI